MTQETNQLFDMLARMIADETADLRSRVQHLEHKTTGLTRLDDTGDLDKQPELQTLDAYIAPSVSPDLEQRFEAIKNLHRLDASPVQWTRGNGGQMIPAPEGLWEISCLACSHKVVWQEGDKEAPHCKTWMLANGSLTD